MRTTSPYETASRPLRIEGQGDEIEPQSLGSAVDEESIYISHFAPQNNEKARRKQIYRWLKNLINIASMFFLYKINGITRLTLHRLLHKRHGCFRFLHLIILDSDEQ
jgi:hypothetical protein